jgi:acetyltransferase-like isoleucine patch superfamily enzyme
MQEDPSRKKDAAKLEDKDFIRYKLFEDKKSLLRKYSDLVIGSGSYYKLIKYEFLTTLLGPIPGATGLLLRKLFYPMLFQRIEKGVSIGRSVTIRHPARIKLGNRVVIDDYSVLDARGSDDQGITFGDDVFIGRGVTIQSKVGPISIGEKVSIGSGTSLIAQGGIIIDEMVNIAGNCVFSGGTYQVGRDTDSIREHGKITKGPIHIEKKCRFGMGAMVLDGVYIEEGTIIGAMSLVTENLPKYSVAAGIPAKVIYHRDQVIENEA